MKYRVLLIVVVTVILGGVAIRSLYASRPPLPMKDPGGYRTYVEYESARIGFQNMLEKITYELEDASPSNQHFAVHILGEIIYERRGIPGFGECSHVYGFGCHHGFLSRAIAEQGEAVIPDLDRACVVAFNSTLATGCQHGIGHGVLDYVKRDVMQALALCRHTTVVVPILGCMSGVFMEYFNPQDSGVPGVPQAQTPQLNVEQPFDICLTMEEEYRRSCYFELPVWWLGRTEHDFVFSGSLCEKAPDAVAREYCYLGFGNIIGPMTLFDIQESNRICDAMPSRLATILCTAGVYWSFVSDETYATQADSICTRFSEDESVLCIKKGSIACYDESRCIVNAHL